MSDIASRRSIEIDFWRTSPDESPEADSLRNVVNKAAEAEVFLACIDRHRGRLATSGRVLELGGGQGWASCIYKKLFPETRVTATDISPYAVMSLRKWEHIYGVKVDNAYHCTSDAIPEPDASLDQVFCFAAAHHFVAHEATLLEIARVLKPGGRAFYFHEPATPRFFYRAARDRVMRKRPEVPEDLLITPDMHQFAGRAGLRCIVDHDPSVLRRGALETIYYLMLGRLAFLQPMLPCSTHFVFEKPAR